MSGACPASGLTFDAPRDTTELTCPHCGRRLRVNPCATRYPSWDPAFDRTIHGECFRAQLPTHQEATR